MYRVSYLRFAACFPICNFSSGVKCWYGDRLDVTIVTSHMTTAYNFAEKTFTNWLQTVKLTKVFSLEGFPLYSIHFEMEKRWIQPDADTDMNMNRNRNGLNIKAFKTH